MKFSILEDIVEFPVFLLKWNKICILSFKSKMNKYLKRGLVFLIIGVLLCYYGVYSKDPIASFYKIPLVLGVLSFGYGFIMVIYSLMRKIERGSILEERAEQVELDEQNEREGEQ